MTGRDEPSIPPLRSPSFSQVANMAKNNRTVSVTAPKSVRPPPKRSVSGSAETGQFTNFTTMESPAQTPNDSITEDPIIALHKKVPGTGSASVAQSGPQQQQQQQQRSMTASPSVFGMSKLDQSGWSDSSGPNTSSSSSVWNGRGATTTDSDAIGTATTSTVSTPGRASTVEPGEMTGAAASFTPSPLLPQGGSAWSNVRTSTVTWAKGLANGPQDYKLEPDSSPSATKGGLSDDRPRPTASKTVMIEDQGAKSVDSKTPIADSQIGKEDRSARAPAPASIKRAPVRSTTLDPSQLPGNRGPSDDEVPSGSQDDLSSGFNNMSIDTKTADENLQGVSGHMQRPSDPYPPPFSPGEAYVHPLPFVANAGPRSPEAFQPHYPGVGPMLPTMGNMPHFDMSGYESYRTTPDPYAPTMPGRAIFVSPGSQGSTPQSPSFGPSHLPPHHNPSMRNGEALFYPGPGVGPGFAGPPMASGPMGSSIRPMMAPGNPHYGFAAGPGSDSMSPQLGQSPMLAPGMPVPITNMVLPPTSPIMQGQMSPSAGDRRMSQGHGHGHQYVPGIHRRMGSNTSQFGPGVSMSPRPPFPMAGQPSGFMPGQHPMHGFPGGAPMPGPSMAWNGRFPDHRRIPTGPGGVMAPPIGFGGSMDPNFARSGFYGAFNGSNGVGPGTQPAGSSRSPLLEDFRNRHAKNRKFELEDIFGSVVEFSGDQHGSRFIQEKLDTAAPEEKEQIFDEILPQARQLMTDVFGNYVIQKMLEHGSDSQRSILAKEMEGHVLSLSLGTYGCRVVQKAFDHTGDEQRIILAKELDGHIMQCVRDQNANHVVQKIIERVNPREIDFIPKAFQGQVPVLASHCYSCRVLQRIFEHCDESQSRPLLDELHADSYRLMQDQYGNYVIQWVLQRGQPRDREQVFAKIKGSILQLSRHKFASNVIEEVIRTSDTSDRDSLIEEILTPQAATADGPDATKAPSGQKIPPAVLMMKDQFANYVLQRFLEKADKDQRAKLINAIRPHLSNAKKFPQGHSVKHLVAIERLIDSLSEGLETASEDRNKERRAADIGK